MAQVAFKTGDATQGGSDRPLADRLRPQEWALVEGLGAVDPGILALLQSGRGTPPSLILWGPPGSGKTTLARLVGRTFGLPFRELSAVLAGVAEIRAIVSEANGAAQILFVDEIHRFNRAQQDALLPHIESGRVIFIGATTENPSFALNAALLSRARVIVLRALPEPELLRILTRAEAETSLELEEASRKQLVAAAGGDARRLLNVLETLAQLAPQPKRALAVADLERLLGPEFRYAYDRAGEEHYNLISAFIKSLRGSNPEGALYWGFRILEGGEDPRFLLRRMMIFASEDIGNADPRALELCVATAQAFERLGLPEGRIPIAHCITYLCGAPKSNRSYLAMHAALEAVKRFPRAAVPLHLRNAPTGLMTELGYGEGYRYPHDEPSGFAAGVSYLPPELEGQLFYEPSDFGAERHLKERLLAWRLRGTQK